MFKLGKRVKVKKDTTWYSDIGESIGVIVCVKNNFGIEYGIAFLEEDFLEDFSELHDCYISESEIKEINSNVFEHCGISEAYELKEPYKGYWVWEEDLILFSNKKGNTDMF